MTEYKLGEIKRGRELGFKSLKTAFIWVECPACKNKRWTITLAGKAKYSYCTHCYKKGEQGKKYREEESKRMKGKYLGAHSKSWKGGRTRTTTGYISTCIYPGDPYFSMTYKSVGSSRYRISEHRLIMAQHLGRCLEHGEVVHHKNGVKDDNRIENLELTSSGKHITDHHKGYTDGFKKGYEDGLKMARCQNL
jgi:ribosomal protein S27E